MNGSTPTRSTRRRELAEFGTAERDALGILDQQNATRLPDLVPLRSERMAASPFAFYRGTAAIMAADQGRDPHSGIIVASCGDAHVSNFGLYASPQRTIVFDLNDFDEAAWAPWEWDLKRLVTSVIIGGRETERNADVVDRAARGAIESYAEGMRSAAARSPIERYYRHFDPRTTLEHLEGSSRRALRDALKTASKRTGDRAARRMTEKTAEGAARRFIDAPPRMTRVTPDLEAQLHDHFDAYRKSTYPDVRMLLSQYTIVDAARRVVGVGSVGTRCYVALLSDPAGGLLILQVKQAGRSVLAEFGGIPQPSALPEAVAAGGEGARVVGLQRTLQAYSDPLLGHFQSEAGDFYVRQFHDMKGGMELDTLDDDTFERYAAACARLLARAHSQSPTAPEVVRYIGRSEKVVAAIMVWCEAYADRSLRDYEDFVASR